MLTQHLPSRRGGQTDEGEGRSRLDGRSGAAAIKVLIVDDDDAYAMLIGHVFASTTSPQLELRHVRYLKDVLPALARNPVSVVLLDVNLPDGNGLEWLRANRAHLDAAVIVLTDMAEFSAEANIEINAQDFLIKSEVEPAHLIRAVRYGAERERARQELVSSREYFQSLIENAQDLITVIDDRGIVLYQSPASTPLLGRAPDTVVGRPLVEIIVAEDVERARSMVASLFEGERSARGEFNVHHANGAIRTLEMVASRIPSVGDSRRAVVNSRDETVRREAEQALEVRNEQLRQAQKMEAIGRLAAGIAHDFNNLLTVITGACERLEGRCTDAARHDYDMIMRNCERGAALTRQLLAFSRQQTLAPQAMDLAELVAGTGRLLKQLIGEHIQLVLDIPSDLKPVEADRIQIEQVLLNLAINGRDAMPHGGALRIRLRDVSISEQFAATHPPMTAGDYVLLEVGDDGHGMSPETKLRAFEPFFTTKHPTQGTGLGLSTVYGIVKQSGGFIWIDTEPNVGTTFQIYLPPTHRAPAPTPAPAPLRAAAPAAGDFTILLTEDEDDVRELLSDMLENHGYKVVSASSPADALERVRDYPGRINLLLTDVVMPGATGRELADAITAVRPETQVLYMSGYPEHGATRGNVLEPGVPFLQKPFTRGMLLDKLRAMLT